MRSRKAARWRSTLDLAGFVILALLRKGSRNYSYELRRQL